MAPGSPTKNQSYTVTPQDEVALDVSTGPVDNTGRRAYSVTGLDVTKEYDIALLPAENVNVDANGNVSFDSVAPVADNSGPSIEAVNGTAYSPAGSGAETEQVNNVEPNAQGTINFVIDSDAADQVVPVVWLDAEATGDDTLDRDANGVPTEEFGIGGQTNWTLAEASDSVAPGAVTVQGINRNLDYFDNGTNTFFYDANDTYRIQGGANLSMAQFENLLTQGDTLSVNYEDDAADASVFEVTSDDVPAASNVEATVANNSATVTWDGSTQPDAVYDIYLDEDTNGALTSTTPIAENVDATTYVINNLEGDATTPVDYEVYVVAVGGVSGTEATEAGTSFRNPPADAAPSTLANGAFVETNAGDAGATDGDVWKLVFDENVTVASDASLLVEGNLIENGVNATFVVNGDMLTVTLTDDIAGLSYGATSATITAASGIDDSAGQEWNPTAAAGDEELEDNGAEVLEETFSDAAGETTATATFNEELIKVSAENEGNYTFTDASAGGVTLQSAVLGADGRTVTFTFSCALATGDTLDILATLLDTDGQAATPATLTVS